MRKFSVSLAGGVSVLALCVPAVAQQADAPAEVQEAPAAADSIIVTADRREQAIQDYAGTAATTAGTAGAGVVPAATAATATAADR